MIISSISRVGLATAIISGFLIPHANSREIIFPPVAAIPSTGQQHAFSSPSHDGPIDISSGNLFSGLTTFANLPYEPCFVDSASSVVPISPYDIAILGAPFDTGVTARPGSRYGPTGIRLGSRRISPDAGWSIYTGRNVLGSWARVIDCGDAPLTFLDNTVALKQLTAAHRAVSGRSANATHQSAVPRILTLGGDHTTTLPALRAAHDHWGPVAVIHFDSHLDTWDPAVLGGGVSEYAGVNHGTFLHLAHEEGLILNSSIHAGIRAPVMRPKGDVRNDLRCGFEIVRARDVDRVGVRGAVERIRERVGDAKVYVSVDIDVLDPAYAPATGTPEVGGWTTRELLAVLDGLEGLKVIGADVVEVAPIYDNAGETTALAAAEVALKLIELMVETPVKALAEEEEL